MVGKQAPSKSKAALAGDRYRTANGSERVKDATVASVHDGAIRISKFNRYPARYRSRFCIVSRPFHGLDSIWDSDPSDESLGYFRSSAARIRNNLRWVARINS